MKKIWTKGSHMPIITHLQNPGVQAEGEPGRGDAEHDLSRGVGSWRPWVCWRVQAGVRHELDWAEGPWKEREWNPDDQQDSRHIWGTLENLLERKTSLILFSPGCELQLPPLPVPGRTGPRGQQAQGAYRSATRCSLEVIWPSLHIVLIWDVPFFVLSSCSHYLSCYTGLPLRVVRMYLLTDRDIINCLY